MLLPVAAAVVVCLNSPIVITPIYMKQCYSDHSRRHRRVVAFVFVIVVIINICFGEYGRHSTSSRGYNFITIKELRLVANEFIFHHAIL